MHGWGLRRWDLPGLHHLQQCALCMSGAGMHAVSRHNMKLLSKAKNMQSAVN